MCDHLKKESLEFTNLIIGLFKSCIIHFQALQPSPMNNPDVFLSFLIPIQSSCKLKKTPKRSLF